MVYDKRRMKRFRRRAKPYAQVASRGFKYARKYTTKGGAAYKALSLARRLADAVNIEYKTQTGSAVLNPTYSGTVVDLTTLITQGAGNGNRVGDSIKLQNLVVRFYIETSSSPSVNEQIRIMIYRDHQNSITTGANMLITAGSVFAPISPKNIDNQYSSNVLFDRVNSFANYAGGAVSKNFAFTIPLNFHTHYQAGSATVKDNALKFLIISDTSLASLTDVRYYFRLSYTDD